MIEKNIVGKQIALDNCNFAKSILMLCVILGHSLAFWSGKWFSVIEPAYSCDWLGWVANWFGTFHIYAFTLISGFIYYYLKCERGHYNDSNEFIAKKSKRLLLPYAFVSIIWLIPVGYYFYHYSLSDVLYIFALGTGPGQLWFLLMLFGVFLLFNSTYQFFKGHRLMALIVVVILHLIGLVSQMTSVHNVFQIFTAFYYLIFFYLGYKISEHYNVFFRKEGGASLNNTTFLVFLVIFNIVAYVCYVYLSTTESLTAYSIIKKLLFEFLIFEGSVTSFAVLMKIGEKTSASKSKVVKLFSDNNFVMYLFHQQIIYICIYWLNGIVAPEVNAMANFAFAFAASLVISIVLRKIKFVRVLLGESR